MRTFLLRRGISVALLALPLAVAGQVLLAYLVSPLAAAALPVAALVAALALTQPIYAVYAATLAVPLEVLEFRLGGEAGLSPSEALLLFAGVAVVIHAVTGRGRLVLQPAHWALLGMLVVIALGTAFAQDSFVVIKILGMWSALLAISVMVASSTPTEVRRVLICLAISGGVVGAIAVVTTPSPELVSGTGGAVVANRAEATFAHSNVLAFFLLLAAPPALALASRGAPPFRALMLACAGLAVAGLMLTLTRGAIVGFAAALVVMLAWQPVRRVILVLIVALAGFALLNSESLSNPDSLSIVGDRLSTLTSPDVVRADPRFVIWDKTPGIILDHPILGIGAGNFGEVSPGYGLSRVAGLSRVDHPHNILLTFAAETGLVGLAMFLVFVAAVVRSAARAVRRASGQTRAMAIAVVAGLAGLAVTSLGEFPIRTHVIMATVVILVGALAVLERPRGTVAPETAAAS